MRRLAVALVLLVAFVSGCAGADGQRAQELLENAMRAQDGLRSATFEAEVSVAAQGEALDFTMRGGGYFNGKRAGDLFLRMETSGLPGAPPTLGIVMRGGRAYFSQGAGWTRIPLPAAAASQQLGAADVSRAMTALADSVEDLSVVEGQLFRGRPVTVINGRLDTARLLESLAADLGGFPAGGLLPVDELRKYLGHVDVALMISERTGLLVGALVSTRIGKGSGDDVKVDVAYRLTRVNKRVRFPALGG